MAPKINSMSFRVSLFALAFSINALAAASYEVNSDASHVDFLAVGKPSMIKIRGTKAKTTGSFSIPTGGEIRMDLDGIDTGISMRDKHMKEKYLQTSKGENKYAIFKITEIKTADGKLPVSGEVAAKIKGMMTLHGETKPLETDAILKSSGETLIADTKLKLKISEYKIDLPTFAGVTVAEDVDVDVHLEAKKAVALK